MKILFLWYLRTFAKLQLFKVRPIIIGVGGASGKSSLASLINLILKSEYKVLESKGKNSETGIPLTVLSIDPGQYSFLDWLRIALLIPVKVITNWEKFDLFIAEMGIDGPYEPKNMSYLLKIVTPKISVLTNIAIEHSEYFDSKVSGKVKNRKERILNLIFDQEKLLLERLPKNGTAVVNIDDDFIKKIKIKGEKITVSTKSPAATYYIKKIITTQQSFKVEFTCDNNSHAIRINMPLPFYYAYSIIDAIALGAKFGINPFKSIEILQRQFVLPPGRFSVFKGLKNTLILDSSYNSSPSAVLETLNLLNTIAEGRRRVAIIGDMRELGEISGQEHERLGKVLLKTTDLVILIGPTTMRYTEKILKKNNHPHLSFTDFTSARKIIFDSIQERDIVLVKGSQNTLFLERVVEMLLKDRSDSQKLCRRGKFWDKKRNETN